MRTLRRSPEVDLVAKLSDKLSLDGWDVRHSVRFIGREIDLVCVRESERGELTTLAVEAKQRPMLSVYSKSIKWLEWASFSVVAVAFLPPDDAWGCYRICERFGLGLWVDGVMDTEPQMTSAHPERIKLLADAARKSSRGIVQPGGARSPIAVKKPHLLAEKVLTAWRATSLPMLSVRDTLPDCSDSELAAAVKVLRKYRGDPYAGYYAVRDSGSDWLLVR